MTSVVVTGVVVTGVVVTGVVVTGVVVTGVVVTCMHIAGQVRPGEHVGDTHRLHGGRLLLRLVDIDLDVEEVADRLFLDRLVHRLEELEALALVLDQRVALGHRAQADALLEVVHLVEVLTPLAVEDRQHDATLDLTHDLLAQLLLTASYAWWASEVICSRRTSAVSAPRRPRPR